MLQIYHTLVRMKYLDPSWIQEGPHDITALLPLYNAFGLDASIIYLYSILPYVDTADAEGVDFVLGGAFADFRRAHSVEQGRDRMYAGQEEAALPPWMTPLSLMGSRYGAIVYDAREHSIRFFRKIGWRVGEKTYLCPCSWAWANSQAAYVLRGIVFLYRQLIEVPGVGEQSGPEWRKTLVEPLYRKHGWPHADFDGDAFLVDQARAAVVYAAKSGAEEFMEKARDLEDGLQDYERFIMWQMRDEVAAAQTVDEEWLARWELMRMEQWRRLTMRSLREAMADADRLWPVRRWQAHEEMLLCELRELREESWGKQRILKSLQQQQVREMGAAGGDGNVDPGLRIRLAHAERQAATYQRAYEACQADAKLVCPGRSLPLGRGVEATGVDHDALLTSHEAHLEGSEQDVEAIRAWMPQLPDGAHQARARATAVLEELEDLVQRGREHRRELARELEEM